MNQNYGPDLTPDEIVNDLGDRWCFHAGYYATGWLVAWNGRSDPDSGSLIDMRAAVELSPVYVGQKVIRYFECKTQAKEVEWVLSVMNLTATINL